MRWAQGWCLPRLLVGVELHVSKQTPCSSSCARPRDSHPRRFVLLFLALVAIGPAAFVHLDHLYAQTAQTYYVSATGNDSNAGTELHPFRTIQHAADLVNPGDTVIVEDGIYTGIGTGTACASSTKPIVCLTRGGSSTSLVTFRARHVGGAKLDGQNNTSTAGFRFLANANYIRIEGFDVYGMGNAAGGASGFELYNGGHDVIITQNHIHDIGHLCTDTSNGEVGIFVEQPRVTITQNTIHDIGRYAAGENGCNPATAYYQNHDHGIYVDGDSYSGIPGASNALIANNIFYNNARGWAIQVYPGTIAGLSILNNTFAFPNPYRDGHIILGANTSDARIMNNIFYNPRKVAINYYTGTQTNLQVTGNLVFNAALMNTTPPGTLVISNQSADPLLLNPLVPPYDFHLTSASPAIDAGVTLLEVPTDFEGVTRPQGNAWDMGAFEYGSSPPPPPPVTVTVSPSYPTVAAGATQQFTASVANASNPSVTWAANIGTISSSGLFTAPMVTVNTTGTVTATSVADPTASGVDQVLVTAPPPPPPPTDTTPPVVTITSVVPKRNSVNVSVNASDNVGVVKVELYLDGVLKGTLTAAPYHFGLNTRQVSHGTHTLESRGYDAAGNVGLSAPATFTK